MKKIILFLGFTILFIPCFSFSCEGGSSENWYIQNARIITLLSFIILPFLIAVIFNFLFKFDFRKFYKKFRQAENRTFKLQ